MPAQTLPAPPPLDELPETVALFLDFDGTLVELAERPDAIVVPGDFGERIGLLADRLEGRLALVSGRACDALIRHCGPLRVAVAGSHGADTRLADGSPIASPDPLPRGATAGMAALADDRPGLLYEAKPHGGAVHYRDAPEHEPAVLRAMHALADAHGLTVKRGKCVAELVRPGESKAQAVDRFMARAPFAGARPVFIGDDVTDEDGFRAAEAHGGFGIAVGERPSDHARHHLADPAAVADWLRL